LILVIKFFLLRLKLVQPFDIATSPDVDDSQNSLNRYKIKRSLLMKPPVNYSSEIKQSKLNIYKSLLLVAAVFISYAHDVGKLAAAQSSIAFAEGLFPPAG